MSTLLDLPMPADRLRTSMAAVRVSISWFGTRKSLTVEQKAEAAEPVHAEAKFLSAGKKLLDISHPAFKATTVPPWMTRLAAADGAFAWVTKSVPSNTIDAPVWRFSPDRVSKPWPALIRVPPPIIPPENSVPAVQVRLLFHQFTAISTHCPPTAKRWRAFCSNESATRILAKLTTGRMARNP